MSIDYAMASGRREMAKQEVPLLLRAPEVASLLGISRARAYELVATGALPSIRIGRSVRIPREALETWIKSSTREWVLHAEPP
jgi:excisionase family DNA binding protein